MRRKGLLLSVLCGLLLAAHSPSTLSQEKPSTPDTATAVELAAIISIPADGEFYFGKAMITQAEIPQRLKDFFRGKSPDEQIVYLRVGPSVSYETIVSLIDTIRGAGFDQIGLVRNSKEDSKAQTIAPARSTGKATSTRTATHPSSAASIPKTSESAIIEVKPRNRITLNSRTVPLSRLSSALKRLLKTLNDKTVYIIAPLEMTYGSLVKVIEIAKEAGAQRVELKTH